MYLKSRAHKEGFVSIIIASRMQHILLKGSQLLSSTGVYVRNTAKPNRELYKSGVVCHVSVLLSKLMILPCDSCTPMPAGSPAVLLSTQGAESGSMGLWQAAGQVPLLAWGALTRGEKVYEEG